MIHMNQLQNIFTEDVLNIFCDASIKKFSDGVTVGCPGAIGISGNRKVCWKFQLLPDTTNNNSEITALFFAIMLANEHKHLFREINIFADSKICVYGVKTWYQSWFENIAPDGTLYSSSGTPVANQEVFKDIIRYMVMNNVHVNIYHQKGHVTSTVKSLVNAIKVFEESNGITISPEQAKYICKYNDEIDIKTGMWLERIHSSRGYATRPTRVFEPIITADDLNKYTHLIKGGI